MACITIMDGRGETLYCAIAWAVKRASSGVPKRRGCLGIVVLILVHKPRAKRISCTGQRRRRLRRRLSHELCSADGSTYTESNKLHRKAKHRARPNLSSRQRPKRAPIRRRSRRRQRCGEPHTGHGLGVILA